MLNPVAQLSGQLPIQPSMILPLVLALWMGWRDLKTRRIPNFLTLGVALSGLAFQLLCHGWSGLSAGALGLLLGFSLLFLPYMLGGLGAGDVKALAAMGAWLGPVLVISLFFYMTICGAFLALGMLCWKGKFRTRLSQVKAEAVNWALCRFHGLKHVSGAIGRTESESIPYATALALAMVIIFIQGA
ncbi:MAG: prepilin peptidase [Proteobacteria bacterium]|nr:prepilin peptidase [Pseudomonadota bacterium]MBU4355341.1 prepilin peptidase [Pseudomonadota bacterium]MBU4447986.1 prepilin peptidase [Pseudomonadota bacterium]